MSRRMTRIAGMALVGELWSLCGIHGPSSFNGIGIHADDAGLQTRIAYNADINRGTGRPVASSHGASWTTRPSRDGCVTK
jgi:hypothetical protein